jgi:hypothetical protein
MSASVSHSPGFTATPPQNCLNGCVAGAGDERGPVLCQPGQVLCQPCLGRLDGWLRQMPDSYALLPVVQEHGTVPGNPESAKTKQPDAPAPMRLEVTDLLDTRDGRGVLGVVHAWAQLIRDERRLPAPSCHCDHQKRTHNGHCTALGCACQHYTPGPFYVYAETRLILGHLDWCGQQEWAGDLYAELKDLTRQLSDTIGDYRARPVGKCAAWIDRPGAPLQVLCGGALVMDRDRHGVVCLGCGATYTADDGLRELGLIVGAMFGDNRINQEAS